MSKRPGTGTGIAAAVLSLALMLTAACGAGGGDNESGPGETAMTGRTVDHAADYLGPEVLDADVLWIEPIADEELGDTLQYREILNLEAFVARSPVPVLIIMRNTLDGTGPRLIPFAENLAMEVRDDARIVFISYLYDDSYLDLLEDLNLPSFHLIHESSMRAQAEGLDSTAIENIIRDLHTLIEEAF